MFTKEDYLGALKNLGLEKFLSEFMLFDSTVKVKSADSLKYFTPEDAQMYCKETLLRESLKEFILKSDKLFEGEKELEINKIEKICKIYKSKKKSQENLWNEENIINLIESLKIEELNMTFCFEHKSRFQIISCFYKESNLANFLSAIQEDEEN